jgi:hypothetical protein
VGKPDEKEYVVLQSMLFGGFHEGHLETTFWTIINCPRSEGADIMLQGPVL